MNLVSDKKKDILWKLFRKGWLYIVKIRNKFIYWIMYWVKE